MTDILEKLPKEIQQIVYYYIHNLRWYEIVLSFKYMVYCEVCDTEFVNHDIFTNEYKNELGRIKWKFGLPWLCNFINYKNNIDYRYLTEY